MRAGSLSVVSSGRPCSGFAALLTILGICGMIALVPNRSEACSYEMPQPRPGVLSGVVEFSGSVPRNVAFVSSFTVPSTTTETMDWVAVRLEDGQEVSVYEVPGTRASEEYLVGKPADYLPANSKIQVHRWTEFGDSYDVTDEVDESAPSQPEVESGDASTNASESSCGTDSCGTVTTATVKLARLATDDLATPEHLVYLFYLGNSAREAESKANPDSLHMASSVEFDLRIWQLIDEDWLDGDIFASVAVMDQAANISARSRPLQIHSRESSDGCAMRRRRQQHINATACILWSAVLAAFARRFGRRRIFISR